MTRRVRPLHQGADGRPIAGPLDEVAFPVAGHRAGGHVGRALGNRRHIGELAPSIGPSRPRPARLARLTQRRQQFAPQGAAWQHIQARIDGLCRELFPHVVRIRAFEAPGNLFGRAALGQVGPAHTATARDPGVCGSAVADRLGRPPASVPCRRDTGGPASLLRADSRLRVLGARPNTVGHRPQRMAVGQAQTQGLTFFGTQVCIASRSHGNTVAHQGLQCCTWS